MDKQVKQNHNLGFSLVELSIALIVIALLAAATVQGRNLLRSAKVQGILKERERLLIAITSFDIKYDKYPGDFNKAASYWTLYNSGSNANGTENGDADGRIEYRIGSDPYTYEGFRAWQHLHLAQILEETYDGAQGPSDAATPGIDIPESVVPGAGYHLDYGVYGFTYFNVLVYGKPVITVSSPVLVTGALSPGMAHILDNKSDDGIPDEGSIHGNNGNSQTGCTTGSTFYDIDGTDALVCAISYKLSEK